VILLLPACDEAGDPIAPAVPAVTSMAGRVISSATGDPVAGAEVSIGSATATTGPDGSYELTDLATGPATLRCVAAGFEDFETNLMVRSGAASRDITLRPAEDVIAPAPPASTVSGRVIISGTGDPVAGAQVSIGAAIVTTGFDGRFELTGLAAGPATLRSRAAGFEDFEEEIIVPSGGMTRDISLTPVDVSGSLQISAALTDGFQYIGVFQDDEIVNNAAVTVNGSKLVRGTPGCEAGECTNYYHGRFPLAAGSPVFLQVMARGLTVRASGNVPEVPVLTAPASDTVYSLSDSIAVTWTSATDPDIFNVLGQDCNGFGPCLISQAPGTARRLKIAASDLVTTMSVIGAIIVTATNEGSFTGPADPASRMTVESGSSAPARITIHQ
jgi:hypothetical protein